MIKDINYKEWVENVGLPPYDLNFKSVLIDESVKLADDFIDLKGEKNPDNWKIF
jgi:hypothetical protein